MAGAHFPTSSNTPSTHGIIRTESTPLITAGELAKASLTSLTPASQPTGKIAVRDSLADLALGLGKIAGGLTDLSPAHLARQALTLLNAGQPERALEVLVHAIPTAESPSDVMSIVGVLARGRDTKLIPLIVERYGDLRASGYEARHLPLRPEVIRSNCVADKTGIWLCAVKNLLAQHSSADPVTASIAKGYLDRAFRSHEEVSIDSVLYPQDQYFRIAYYYHCVGESQRMLEMLSMLPNRTYHVTGLRFAHIAVLLIDEGKIDLAMQCIAKYVPVKMGSVMSSVPLKPVARALARNGAHEELVGLCRETESTEELSKLLPSIAKGFAEGKRLQALNQFLATMLETSGKLSQDTADSLRNQIIAMAAPPVREADVHLTTYSGRSLKDPAFALQVNETVSDLTVKADNYLQIGDNFQVNGDTARARATYEAALAFNSQAAVWAHMRLAELTLNEDESASLAHIQSAIALASDNANLSAQIAGKILRLAVPTSDYLSHEDHQFQVPPED